jgi:flagellar biosynthesis protein FliR
VPPLPQIEAFLFVLVRCFSFFAIGPLLSDRRIPNSIKIVAALATAFALFPSLPVPIAELPTNLLSLAVALVREVLLGVLLGLTSSFIFAGIRMAGNLLGIQMGFSIANVLDPNTATETSLVAELYAALALVLFVLTDGHHIFLRALAFSLQRVPPGGGLAIPALVGTLLPMAGSMFLICIQVGAPILGALFLADAALGFVARAVPQMNVFIVGIPAKIGLGLVLVVVTAPLFAHLLTVYLSRLQGQLSTLLAGM